jgi:hypothetical protein
VRVSFQLVVFADVAIEMEDFLSVGAAHALSLRIWSLVVKRTTLLATASRWRRSDKCKADAIHSYSR